MWRSASPKACVPEAQALTVLKLAAFALQRMPTSPAAMFEMSAGIMNGETRRGPFSKRACDCVSIVSMPPMPEPMMQPMRLGSTSPTFSPASSIAFFAATTA